MARANSPMQSMPIGIRRPLGMALSTWRYLRRVPAIARRSRTVTGSADDLPTTDGGPDVQDARQDGVGPLYHRHYRARIDNPQITAEELIQRIGGDPNATSPVEVAEFEKTKGTPGRVATGDEFLVRMPGPWLSPVRVEDVDAHSFTFVTLDGHIEAGKIIFRAAALDTGSLAFEIESLARSGNKIVDLLYDRVGVAREMQLNMWVHVCERAAEVAGGTLAEPVGVDTVKVEVGS